MNKRHRFLSYPPTRTSAYTIGALVSALIVGGVVLLFGFNGLPDKLLSRLPEPPAAVFRSFMWLVGAICMALPLIALCGVILAFKALIRIRREGGRPGGTVMTIGSLLICVIYLASIPWVLVKEVRREESGAVCGENIGRISLAMHMYLTDNEGAFPPADGWREYLKPYAANIDALACPAAHSSGYSYAYNSALGGLKYDSLQEPEVTVAIFESDQGGNAAGGPEMLTPEPRHSTGDIVAVANGSTTWVSRRAETELLWNPMAW